MTKIYIVGTQNGVRRIIEADVREEGDQWVEVEGCVEIWPITDLRCPEMNSWRHFGTTFPARREAVKHLAEVLIEDMERASKEAERAKRFLQRLSLWQFDNQHTAEVGGITDQKDAK